MRIAVRIAAAAIAAGCVMAIALPDLRWRSIVAARKVVFMLQDVGWSDLWQLEKPNSKFELRKLASSGNPYLAIVHPDATAADIARGRDLFALNCAKCHGDAATGGTGPKLVGRALRVGDSDWAIYRTIMRGIESTAMQGGLLAPDEVWLVIGYLRDLARHGTGAAGSRGAGPAAVALQEVTASRLLESSGEQKDWMLPGGSYNGQRFSKDNQITTRNVSHLAVQWIHQFASTNAVNESTPIVAGDFMFVTVAPSTVIALDVKSGAELWQYSRPMPADLRLCCLNANRGVAILGRTVYMGTLDAHLLALEAGTGKLLWDTKVAEYTDGYSITSAPLPVGDAIITGIAGGDFPTRGFISSYDASTGALRWRFRTVPEPGEPGNETWGGDSWKTGGASTWGIGAYDPELGLLYWGVGNPAPDYNAALRPGDNLYSNSLVALDAATGKLAWHFQFTPGDDHDWDSVQTPALIELKRDGRSEKLLAVANRNGFFYVLDRKDGRFLRAAPFAQQTWVTGLTDSGRPTGTANSHPTLQGTYLYPSVTGATNWWPSAYSPAAQLYFVSVLERGGLFFSAEPPPDFKEGKLFTAGLARFRDGEPFADYVRAIDPVTASIRWERRNVTAAQAPRGGLLATAGGLVFGSDGSVLYALDASTGAQLWSIDLGWQISAPPITFRMGAKQIVAVVAGHDLATFALTEP